MLFTTKEGKSFDTQDDLTAPERHILQKLFLWETMASSMQEFREKKDLKTVAITGYTNAGKSTLFNALLSKKVVVESDTCFSSIDPKINEIFRIRIKGTVSEISNNSISG